MKLLPKYEKIPAAAIKPLGWYKDILNLQAEGLTGAAGDIFPDLSASSAWLGGAGEAWERGPYYFDGLAPLSFLLENDTLSKKRDWWLEAIISSQREDGNFGPVRNPDWWPRMVVLKTLARYNESKKDERIIPFMVKYLRFQYQNIDIYPPHFWAKARALEAYEAIEYVYRQTNEPFLIDLATKLSAYMYDWVEVLSDYPYKKPMSTYVNRAIFKLGKFLLEPIDKISKASKRIKQPPNKKQAEVFGNLKLVRTIMLTHGVNLAMALKYPAVIGMLTGERKLLELSKKAYKGLMALHGTAIGLFTSDEHIMGTNPSQGIELCTVVEAMYSFEELLRLTGDIFYADLLEFLFYNALPATFTDDICAHQYVQQVNQIKVDKRSRQFFDTNKEANLLGVAPNFGCCMSNLHQGFTKIAECLLLKNAEELAVMVYAPYDIAGQGYSFSARGDYPFGDSMEYSFKSDIKLILKFRIPKYTTVQFVLNGKEIKPEIQGRYAIFSNGFDNGDVLSLQFCQQLAVVDNPDGSISIRYGSLLLAMPLDAKEFYIRGDRPFHFRGYKSTAKWQAAPLPNSINNAKIKYNGISSKPFSLDNPSLEVVLQGCRIDWREKKGSAAAVAASAASKGSIQIRLVPYGCTKLRITQFSHIESQEGECK